MASANSPSREASYCEGDDNESKLKAGVVEGKKYKKQARERTAGKEF
jgi:hypothetical protein